VRAEAAQQHLGFQLTSAANIVSDRPAVSIMPLQSFAIHVHMRLNARIYTFVNACCIAAQACKGCMTKLFGCCHAESGMRLESTPLPEPKDLLSHRLEH